jgi:hypothetical protein
LKQIRVQSLLPEGGNRIYAGGSASRYPAGN